MYYSDHHAPLHSIIGFNASTLVSHVVSSDEGMLAAGMDASKVPDVTHSEGQFAVAMIYFHKA